MASGTLVSLAAGAGCGPSFGPSDDAPVQGDADDAAGDDDATAPADDDSAPDDDATTDDDATPDGDTTVDDDATTDDDAASDDDATPDPPPDWPLAPWLGLDINAPVDPTTGDIGAQVDAAWIASSGAGWARVNFILGPWTSPEDDTPHGALGLGWAATYRVIVDSLRLQGLSVYGLIGGESVRSAGAVGSETWLDDYVYAFVAVVDRFKDTVRVFESFNEPNNWVAEGTPALDPSTFALLLQEVWLETRHHNGHWGDPAWQVTLVSGPLFSHDADTAAAYLDETYWYGRNVHAWDWTHAETGSYPLDGLGYHLYVAQGTADGAALAAALDGNLGAVQGTLEAWEGVATPKRLWVSEMGWMSDVLGEAGQAEALGASLRTLRDDPRVTLATWFCLVDFPGASYGLAWGPHAEKAAFARMGEVAAE